jgi:UDP-glucose 4-epimerase
MLIYGDGKQSRAFSCIDNCLNPLWKAATNMYAKNETINLGGSIQNTIGDLQKIVANVTGNEKVEYREARHEVFNAYSTTDKSELLLDYDEKLSIETCLMHMWGWVNTVEPRKVRSFKRYEIDKGIYDYWKTGDAK